MAAMAERTVVEWDKNDLDALGILKVDILALGMLTASARAFELMHQHYGLDLTLAGVLDEEREDQAPAPARRAGIERPRLRHDARPTPSACSRSRAGRRCRCCPGSGRRSSTTLVIEVAIVRPGPIQGGMVHPYLKRRQGIEKMEPIRPELEAVLDDAGHSAVPGAGDARLPYVGPASPGRGRPVAKGHGHLAAQRPDRAVPRTLHGRHGAARLYQGVRGALLQADRGFGEYGFPESHAASFALLVYVSCWLKCHYPDVFACALLNSQPMGFYAPAQIVRDAIEHGVEVREVDVNRSDLQHVLEDGTPAKGRVWTRHAGMQNDIRSTRALRLGLAQVKGLKEEHANRIVARRAAGYDSVRDLWLRTGLAPAVLERLAEADAFASLGLSRRDALWAVRGLQGTDGAETLPLFAAAGPRSRRAEPDADLPPMPPGEQVVHDYRSLSLSLKGHPVSFLRETLDRQGFLRAQELATAPAGRMVGTAGLVLVRQRPARRPG